MPLMAQGSYHIIFPLSDLPILSNGRPRALVQIRNPIIPEIDKCINFQFAKLPRTYRKLSSFIKGVKEKKKKNRRKTNLNRHVVSLHYARKRLTKNYHTLLTSRPIVRLCAYASQWETGCSQQKHATTRLRERSSSAKSTIWACNLCV